MIHEVLSYRVFREAGIAAPRTGYACVRVNGDDYGLYLNLETPDEVMLRAWYESTQHLYEGAYGADAVPGGAQAFEVDEGSEADRADLEALIAAIVAPVGIWSEAIEPVLDLRQATRMWAVEKYVGHLDGYAGAITDANYPNNYFLHGDVGGRFTFMPWGTDWTWRDRIPFDSHGGYLFHACLWNERCRGLYRDAVAEVSALASGLDLDALAEQTAQTLRPWQQSDPRREHSMDQIDAEVESVRRFIAQRPAGAAAWLDGPPARAETVPPFRVAIHAAPTSRTRARRVRFRFKANRHGATFKCKLDRRRYAPCRSLIRLRVAPGPHRFRVRAASPQGEVARDNAKFVVVAKRRRGRGRGR
jgi:hypothetical protein